MAVISGRLKDVPIEDILSLIAGGRKSGVLIVNLDDREAKIHFEDGKILYARVEDGANLGEYMVRLELTTPEDIQGLISRQKQENPHTLLGMMAVRGGVIGEQDLRTALEAQVLDAMTEILIWADIARSKFHFKERGLDASQVPTPHLLDASGMLMESTRRLDEWRRGQVKPFDVLEVAVDLQNDPRTAKLNFGQWEMIYLVDGQRSAASVAAELNIPEGETYHQLFLMLEQQLLRLVEVRGEDPWVLIISTSQTTRRLCTLTLTRERYRVMHASNLESAKNLLETRRPNTVLLEWEDPLETIKQIRDKRNLTPIVAIVKTEPKVSIGLFRNTSTTNVRYLIKPYSEMQLIRTIGAVTGRAV
jgi:CheY-like chemotaxis protein